MAVAKSLDNRKRPALKRRAKQQRPVNRPEKARRASLISPTDFATAISQATAITKSLDKTKTRRSEEQRPFFLRFFVFQIRRNPVIAVFKPTFE
jgi:hypothetical protein